MLKSNLTIPLIVQAGLTSMRSTAHSNQPMNRERKQVLAETVQNLEESQIEGDMPAPPFSAIWILQDASHIHPASCPVA